MKFTTTGFKARTKLTEGIDFLADAVQSTMGPFGQNFALEKGMKITNDGLTIANEIEVEDEVAQHGIKLVREASQKTEKEVKDASSTAIVLTRAIYKEALKQLPSEHMPIGKMTPAEVAYKIEAEKEHVFNELGLMAEPIETIEQLIDVATVSTEDRELGKLIAEAQYTLGEDGILIAEEDISGKNSIEYVKGIVIDNGLASTQVINNQEKQSLEVSDMHVILTSNTVKETMDSTGKVVTALALKQFEGIIRELAQNGSKGLVIVARAFTEGAIRECMAYIQAGYPVYPVNAPYTDQNEIMKDMESVLGGTYLNFETRSLDTITINDIGYAENIVVERYRAVFTGKASDATNTRTQQRVEELKLTLQGNVSLFTRENIEKRLAQLNTGFAIIHIGNKIEAERKRLKDKADDAVGTVRMALKEGVVKGAGQAFKEIAEGMDDNSILKAPLQVIYKHIKASAPKDFVIQDWVKDPVRTLRIALGYACAVASTLATAGGVITTKKEKPRLMQEVPQDNE